MTDPNVLKALRLISDAAYHAIPNNDSPGSAMALTLLDKADALLAAAEKPAAPVAVITDEVRDFTPGDLDRLVDAVRAHGSAPLPSIQTRPAAPDVPVKFDATDCAVDTATNGRQWSAEIEDRLLTVRVLIKPGEDAGEVTARMLASVGRTA